MNNEKPQPDYDGIRTVISLGNEPALKPILAKKPVEKSPQISDAEMSRDAVIGLQASSRRIKLVKALDIFLRHNPDSLDDAEAFVGSLTSAS